MKVQLIASTRIHTEALAEVVPGYDPYGGNITTDPDALTEAAGRICYLSWHRPNPATATNRAYLAHIIEEGHLSVMEHSTATFYIGGVTRNLLLEEERHRFLSHSVKSQRYVAEGEDDFAVHPTLAAEGYSGLLANLWRKQLDVYESVVATLRATGYTRKEAREAARHFLLSCGSTEYLVTANLRAWREFVARRTHPAADKEIQAMARVVRDQLRELAPGCFQDLA